MILKLKPVKSINGEESRQVFNEFSDLFQNYLLYLVTLEARKNFKRLIASSNKLSSKKKIEDINLVLGWCIGCSF